MNKVYLNEFQTGACRLYTKHSKFDQLVSISGIPADQINCAGWYVSEDGISWKRDDYAEYDDDANILPRQQFEAWLRNLEIPYFVADDGSIEPDDPPEILYTENVPDATYNRDLYEKHVKFTIYCDETLVTQADINILHFLGEQGDDTITHIKHVPVRLILEHGKGYYIPSWQNNKWTYSNKEYDRDIQDDDDDFERFKKEYLTKPNTVEEDIHTYVVCSKEMVCLGSIVKNRRCTSFSDGESSYIYWYESYWARSS